jgi:hypothetical protein
MITRIPQKDIFPQHNTYPIKTSPIERKKSTHPRYQVIIVERGEEYLIGEGQTKEERYTPRNRWKRRTII